MVTLRSVQMGTPQEYGDPSALDKSKSVWRTAFFKTPVFQEVLVTKVGLVGDDQADRKNHGGIDKAILAYSSDHYKYWENKLSRETLPWGAFGENLSIEGQTEKTVCIGDQFRIGSSILEVSQPRQPCWKLGRRWNEKLLPKMVVENGFCGWYLRVMAEGAIEQGMSVELIERPFPQWSIQRANDFLYQRTIDPTSLSELFILPSLSSSWKESLG